MNHIKVPEEKKAQIIKAWVNREGTQRELAERYQVSRATFQRTVNGIDRKPLVRHKREFDYGINLKKVEARKQFINGLKSKIKAGVHIVLTYKMDKRRREIAFFRDQSQYSGIVKQVTDSIIVIWDETSKRLHSTDWNAVFCRLVEISL